MTRKLSFTLCLLVITIGVWLKAPAQNPSGGQKPATAAKSSTAAPSGGNGDYVGSEVCVTCHAEQQKSFVHTIMGNAMAHPKTATDALGCEACHGPGKAHVEAGGGKDTIPVRFTKDSNNPVEERNAACLSCHTKGNQMFWRGSPHESRAMACVDCHQRPLWQPCGTLRRAFVGIALWRAAYRARRHQKTAAGVVSHVPPDAAGTVAALFAYALPRR